MHGVDFSKKLFDGYFKNKTNGVLIECGAYDGINHSIGKFFEEECNWDCINIEPNPRLYRNLIKNRPNSFLNISKALSSVRGTTELVVPKNIKDREMRGHGTIAEYRINTSEKKFGKDKANRYTVDTITYRDMIEENNINEVDLFILDVEGHEIDVIEGMHGCNVLPRVMAVEVDKVDKDDVLFALNKENNWIMDYFDDHDAFYLRKD